MFLFGSGKCMKVFSCIVFKHTVCPSVSPSGNILFNPQNVRAGYKMRHQGKTADFTYHWIAQWFTLVSSIFHY